MNVEAGAVATLGATGLTLYGDRYRGPGVTGTFYFRNFTWSNLPGTRADDEPRPMGDGNFPAPSYLESITHRMGGFLVARSHEYLVREMNRLKSLRGRTMRLTVDEPGLTAWGTVEIRAVEFEPFGFAPEADFRVDFYMADPRKYGPSERVFGSGELAYHRGNLDAVPSVRVTGNMPLGYAILGPDGKQYVVTQPLTAGITHRIDFSTGLLYRSNVLQQGAVSRAEVWTVPPGPGVEMRLVTQSGGGTLAVEVPYTST